MTRTLQQKSCQGYRGKLLEVAWIDGNSSFAPTGPARPSTAATGYQLQTQITKYAYAKTLKLKAGDPDVDDAAEGASSANGKARGATDNQVGFTEDLQERASRVQRARLTEEVVLG